MLIGDAAVGVGDALHQIRGAQIAAVDAGGLSRDEGDGSDVEVLAESVAGQIQLSEAGGIGEDAVRLAAQVDAGAFHEAEGSHVLVERGVAQLQAVGDKGRVAGVPHGLDQGLQAVTGLVGAVDGLSGDGDKAAAVDGGVLVDDTLLQRGGQRQDLEGGAGLVSVVQRLVAPLKQLHLRQRVLAAGDALLQGLVLHGGEVIQVIVGVGGHGQDAAGVDVHDDACGAVGGSELIGHILQTLFQIVLDGGVQRQRQVAAVLGGEVLFIGVHHVVAGVVLGGHHQTALTLQLLLVAGLQPVQAGVVIAHEADDMGGQGAVGIVALGVGHQMDAHDLVLIDIGADGVGNLLVSAELDQLVLGLGVVHAAADGGGVAVQYLGQTRSQGVLGPGHGIVLVIDGAVDLQRGEDDGLGAGGDGHDVAAAVVDGAAGGSDHRAAGLLVHGLALQLLMADDLKVEQLKKQQHEHADAHDEHQHEGAGLDDPIGAADIFILAVGVWSAFCHVLCLRMRGPAALRRTGPRMSSKEQEVAFLLLTAS